MGHDEHGGHRTECEGWEKLAMVKDFWTQKKVFYFLGKVSILIEAIISLWKIQTS